MVARLYIVPRIGTGTHDDPYRAKYFGDDNYVNRPVLLGGMTI